MKRLFDFGFAFVFLLVLLPLLVVLSLWISFESRGGPIFLQARVGRHGRNFSIWKLRTMQKHSEKGSQLTIGSADKRITRSGRWLRKYKLDELPQLVNVLKGDMSLVGPRPEVPRYVALYTEAQRKVLTVRPGITDPASLAFFEENELLANSAHPEETYIKEIMPAKLQINLEYLSRRSLWTDLRILAATALRIVRKPQPSRKMD